MANGKPKAPPQPLATLPKAARTAIATVAEKNGLTFEQVAFSALRKLGLSQLNAYRTIRPDVTEDSAKSLGSHFEGAITRVVGSLDVDSLLDALVDWRTLTVVAGADDANALKAADLHNKVSGRYADGITVVNVLGAVPEIRSIEVEQDDLEL